MLCTPNRWVLFGLLLSGIQPSLCEAHRPQTSDPTDATTLHHLTHTGTISTLVVIDPTTIFSQTTLPKTHYVDVTVPYYVNVTIKSTKTIIVSTCITESTTTTLHYTTSVTKTDSATVTSTETTSVTKTDSATVTSTETTTATVPATITTYTTRTVISTTVDPCPSSCSISVETVNVFFWPTDRPYTYPSTYVDTDLSYTFTSPSVYVFIPTARGTNSLGPAGPSTTSWMLELDLDEVSTIVDGSVTRQLTLSDLGTDCPQSADPTAIATLKDSRCDPILAAPKQVSSWAYPCNACGRFGLFDPPYAVPTLTGGLIGTATATPAPAQTTAAPAPTSAPPVGTLLVVYYLGNDPITTATIPMTGISGTLTSSVFLSSTSAPNVFSPSPTSTHTTSTSTSSVSSVVTASATRPTGEAILLTAGILVAVFIL